MKTETEISGDQSAITNSQSQAGGDCGMQSAELGNAENRNIEHRTPNAEHRVPETEGGLPGVVMKKVRADARWNGLSVKQREMLEQWLFEERMSYDVVLERAQKEFAFKGSRSSIRRFYERTAEERMLKNLVTSQEQVNQIRDTPVSAEELRAAGMKVVAQLFLRQVVQAPEQVKEWSRLAKLLLQSESNEIRFRLKREDQELKRKALEFAREKFHYDIMEQGVKVLPELTKLWEQGLTQYERNARRNNLRKRMFGPNIPELLPENEEEEKQMAAQKIIDDAARAKQHEWWYQRFGSPEAKARIAAEREADRAADIRAEQEADRAAEAAASGEPVKGPNGEVVNRGVVYPYGQ